MCLFCFFTTTKNTTEGKQNRRRLSPRVALFKSHWSIIEMPPKRRATRASKKANVTVEEKEDSAVGSLSEEPKPKRTRGGKGKKKVTEEEITPDSVEKGNSVILEKEAETSSKEADPQEQEQKTEKSNSKAVVGKEIPRQKISPAAAVSERQLPTSVSSPTKRLSTVTTRIPSPVKRNSTVDAQKEVLLDFKRLDTSINQSFVSKNLPKLSSIIDELKVSKTEQLFNEFKNSADIRFKTADNLISSLTAQNKKLESELELAQQRIAELEGSGSDGSLAKNTAAEERVFEDELILDMLEQIVGLRIHRAEENDEALTFDCSQSGKNGVLDYRLTIFKEDSSEILYTPIPNDEIDSLRKTLPDYFFDELSFPLDTLQQFYHKIYRGLNK